MEMDWGAAIVGAVIILICILPFVIMYYNRVKKESKMLQALNEVATQQNCLISQHEICGDLIVGIDKNRNFFFFINLKSKEDVSQFIDLSEIQTCRVVNKSRNIKSETGSIIIYERVELYFMPTKKNKGEIRLELFNEATKIELGGELLLADKWSEIINDHLATIKK